MKYCTKCKLFKEVADFSKSKSGVDGLGYRCKGCVKEYCLKNRDRKQKYDFQYKRNNREKVNRWTRERRRNNLEVRLLANLRDRPIKALRGIAKSARTLELLGCSVLKLWAHLESKFKPGMTRENYGPVWELDHIRPCASFDLTDPAQQQECFHFSNLQPLFIFDNRSKGARNTCP